MNHERYDTRYITLHFPLMHIDRTFAKQKEKVVEEYNEFRKELFGDADPERTLHELQDLVQAYITLMMTQAKPTSLDERDTEERVIQLLEQANQDHRKKMERYRADGRLK